MTGDALVAFFGLARGDAFFTFLLALRAFAGLPSFLGDGEAAFAGDALTGEALFWREGERAAAAVGDAALTHFGEVDFFALSDARAGDLDDGIVVSRQRHTATLRTWPRAHGTKHIGSPLCDAGRRHPWR